jgi:uncharacterized membrane protein
MYAVLIAFEILDIIKKFFPLLMINFQYSIALLKGGFVQTISASSFKIFKERGWSKLPL